MMINREHRLGALAVVAAMATAYWTPIATASAAAPTVLSATPDSGPLYGGTAVDISGRGLSEVTGVAFGTAAAASFQVLSDTHVHAISPAHRPGAVDLVVSTPTAHSSASPNDVFTYIEASWFPGAPLAQGHNGQTLTPLNSGFCRLSAAPSYCGRLLIAGGSRTAVEVYDPATGTSTRTSAMTADRYGPTATVLDDGRVLFAGGVDGAGTPLASAEVFDPTNNTWSATGPMSAARAEHTATLLEPPVCALPDSPAFCGHVLVTGGKGSLAGAELYDPSAGTWSMADSLANGRYDHTATLLADGQVLVVGGCCTTSGGSVPTAELYDPSHQTATPGLWTPTVAPAAPRQLHTATLLPSGKVLVAGGGSYVNGAVQSLSTAELFDPTGPSWSPTGSLRHPRLEQSASRLSGTSCGHNCGKVLVVGGFATNPTTPAPLAELYQPDTGAWEPAGSMLAARSHPAAAVLGSGQVMVTGGYSPRGAGATGTDDNLTVPGDPPDSTIEGFDPLGVEPYARGRWSNAAPMALQRANHTATLLDGPECAPEAGQRPAHCGRVLVTGGSNVGCRFPPGDPAVNCPLQRPAEVYDPSTRVWTDTGVPPNDPSEHTATLLDGPSCHSPAVPLPAFCGAVLIVGGYVGGDLAEPVDSASLFHPATNTWTTGQPIPGARYSHTATLLDGPECHQSPPGPDYPCGDVLVVGGANDRSSNYHPLASAEIFRPSDGSWRAAQPLRLARGMHTATLLPSGEVMVAGGIVSAGTDALATNSIEIYDPRSGSWRDAKALMANRRFTHTATVLGPQSCGTSCGKVLLAGGLGAGGGLPVVGSELYDPSTELVEATGTMNVGRGGHAAVVLANGEVLAIGGGTQHEFFEHPGSLATSELYDPSTGRWSLTNSLTELRASPTASVLDGRECARPSPPDYCGKVLVAGGIRSPVPDASGAGATFSDLRGSAELYTPAPAITSLTPSSGPSAGGTTVVISGSSFTAGATVSIGGTPVAAHVDSATTITFTTPPSKATVPVPVVVRSGAGASATPLPQPQDEFTYDGCATATPPGTLLYPAGYSLIGLPTGTSVPSQSLLYGWFNLNSGRYSAEPPGPASSPVLSGHGYWAWFSCPRAVTPLAPGSPSAGSDLAAYHASMIGNPAATGPSVVTGHDFAARWNPSLGDGAGGYEISGYRAPLTLALGEGAWVFAYRDTRIVIQAAG